MIVDSLHSYYLQDVDRYESIRQKAGFAYQQVISSLTDKSLLHYNPNVYPIPFMIVKKYKVRSYLTKVLFYNLTYPDVKDFHKFAIYINVHLIEKYPNHLHGIIGHEIAHIIASRGRVEITKKDLALILKDRLSYIQSKEKSAQNIYSYFPEPIQSNIKKWNLQSALKETENSVSKDSQLVNQESFDKLIFGDKLEDYKQFIKFNLNRVSE
jgi:predicted SprT family Zn-dependent metalloprotease